MTAYIALGANLGDRAENLRRAIECLNADPEIRVLRLSSLLENPAVGGAPDSPAFFNAAAALETTLSPLALLVKLLAIESEMGRVRSFKNAPRPIDLDILLYGDAVIRMPDLVVPHPSMHERRFVLQPLAEIAGDVVHPVLQKTITELLAELSEN